MRSPPPLLPLSQYHSPPPFSPIFDPSEHQEAPYFLAAAHSASSLHHPAAYDIPKKYFLSEVIPWTYLPPSSILVTKADDSLPPASKPQIRLVTLKMDPTFWCVPFITYSSSLFFSHFLRPAFSLIGFAVLSPLSDCFHAPPLTEERLFHFRSDWLLFHIM